MVRSNSRSHSSRSKSRSPSSSRSRSHSRKKRYSSRSRSRTYSRSRSRERVYNRDYHRDYRNNRGMRRPYGFRPRARGYYQGGGGRYHRGGFRPMWNRRYSRSPRRGRSHSRSPRRRSVSSQRSRSPSHRSYKSSQSPKSSSSRSSSRYSKSPVSKKHTSKEKQTHRVDGADKSESPKNSKLCDDPKDAFDPSEPLDELGKDLEIHGDSWAGLSAYENSPRSPCSPSPVASPPSQSSSHSNYPNLSVIHSAKDTLSQNSHSVMHTPEISGSGSGENDSTRYSPSQNSPLHNPSHKSPIKTILSQNPSREEGRSRFSLYTDTVQQDLPKVTKASKKYADDDHKLFPIEKANTKEKEIQKERGAEKNKKEIGRIWDHETADYFGEKEREKSPFLTISESEDLEETEDYRQFRKSVLADQGKGFSSASHWNSDDESTKCKSKTSTKVNKEGDKNREGKGQKVAERASKVKQKDEEKVIEKSMKKKDNQSPDKVKSDKLKDIFSYRLPLRTSTDIKEKSMFREESPLRLKMKATESNHPEVKLKMINVPLDDSRPSSLTNDRLLASTLVHSVKKEQDFRSIFDHIKVSFASKTSPESFTYHIVSLVHQVKEHYFKGDGKTLSERFTEYQKVTSEHSSRPKSPEIHRRIDISPKILRKHSHVEDEDKVTKEEPPKVEKKIKSNSADVRSNVERRKKEHRKERGNSKCSRESSSSRKKEKTHKDLKECRVLKDDNKHKKEHEPSPTPSSGSSHEGKDSKINRDEEFKDPPDPKDYPVFSGIGRPRGTFFRIRGRGRARGVFAGTSSGPVTTSTSFQKRPKEEEWDPEYTPKSKKYFLHDDRDDGIDYWAKRGRGRGNFQRGRGRFIFKKSGSSPKWTHDKYQGDGLLDDEDDAIEDGLKDEKE
ncbi:bcl-2-associated transcription factor 1 isoform X2 [Bombina bombina]|uniref:bcl-2-associated transcription factor 1 isoform X2 n=1 Tax=Bombina bombina TaxID=8345 RepID=UPI00235B1313|nr:bcl-2-associated transcription factor 1 isoform X2 [Bombina bombina]